MPRGLTEYTTIRRKIIVKVMEQFPDASSRALSRILYRDYPEFFKDTEQARSIIRIYKGKSGSRVREAIKMRKFYEEI